MSYSEEEITAVWKRREVSETETTGCDAYGFEMKRDEYGKKPNTYAWEVDHIKPTKGKEVKDNPCNLQPLHWLTNAVKSATPVDEVTLKDLFDYVTPPRSNVIEYIRNQELNRQADKAKNEIPLTFENLVEYLQSNEGKLDLERLGNPHSFEFGVIMKALKRLLDKKQSMADK